jgi:hypothetical protein
VNGDLISLLEESEALEHVKLDPKVDPKDYPGYGEIPGMPFQPSPHKKDALSTNQYPLMH